MQNGGTGLFQLRLVPSVGAKMPLQATRAVANATKILSVGVTGDGQGLARADEP